MDLQTVYLTISIISSALLVISELLPFSKCAYNGILDFFFNDVVSPVLIMTGEALSARSSRTSQRSQTIRQEDLSRTV